MSRMRTPPGRAGRIWLRRRLAGAERGEEQLQRKVQILLPERHRLRLHVDQLRTAWEEACAEALRWHLRVVLLGGEDALTSATPTGHAHVALEWSTSMGLTYPTGASVQVGPSGGTTTLAVGNTATAPAVAAFTTALDAGAQLAAAERALLLVEEETAVTRRRLRALQTRRLPQIRSALHELELVLEQAEQEGHVRLRRALDETGGGRR